MTSIVCGKALWSVVCGTNVLPSNDVVGEELEMAADHLRAGVCYYEPFSEEDHHEWIDSSNLKENQKSFVLRLAKMLNLCSRQAWEFFQVFLQEEYRGSIAELTSVLACYRSESRLLHQIFAFYLTDPMHILSCRTHVLASAAAKQDHPYQELFADFLREALDCEQLLGSNMVEELTCVHHAVMKYRDCQDKAYGGGIFGSQEDEANKNKASALDFVPGNPDLPDDGEYQWLAARLALAKHLLASLLVYYAQPHRKCEPSVVVNLITLAQGEGVCGGVVAPGGQSCQAAVATLLRDIDALHSLLLVLVIDTDEDVRSHKLCAPQWRDQVESLITEFGSRPGHLPPLLAWCVLQGRRALCDTNGASVPSSEVQRYSRMAVRAVDGGVMACLHNFLNNQAVVSDALLKEVCASIVYSVACVAATQLNIDPRAPCSAHLSALAVACVASPVPAHLFWAEEEGTAAVLLPDALLVFPEQPRPLLSLCTALASASASSCAKVMELLSEMPSLTWGMTSTSLAGHCREVGGSQLITHSRLQVLPGHSLPPHTSGTLLLPSSPPLPHQDKFLVQWHAPTNAWQLILAALHELDSQIRDGTTVREWLVEFVEESLELICSVLKSDQTSLTSLEHILAQIFAVIKSVSDVVEPRERLVRWLLAAAGAASERSPDLVWQAVDRCGLLPCLPLGGPKGQTLVSGETGVQYYRCGALRKIVCGQEAAAGRYPALRSFCLMLSSALKAGLSSYGSVRGGVMFVVREVVPFMVLQWGYSTAREKVLVLEAVMEVLHQALECGKQDQQIASEVCSQMSSRSGGATLRAVLEAGACLEASLDAPPAQWPYATHATSLARTAHLALSVLHRIVLMHCDGRNPELDKQRLKNLLAGDQKRPHTQTILPHAMGPSHLTLTVAQFVHHRLNSSLPYLAMRILTKLALELEVPLVACLGSQAEVIKELLLYRLRAAAQDTRVKVAITQLLTAAVANQPGLLRAFLTPPEALTDVLTDLLVAHHSYGDVSHSASSGLLLSSIIELVAALWSANHVAAITALRDSEPFWTVLVTPLNSSKPGEETDSVLEQTLRLIALEHFHAARHANKKLAVGLAEALTSAFSTNWKNLNQHMVGWVGDDSSCQQGVTRLRCWRDLLVVLFSEYPHCIPDLEARELCELTMTSLTSCLGSPEEPLLRAAAHLLADLLLTLASHRPGLGSGVWYWEAISRVLEALRASLLQTPAPTQVRLLTALLLHLQHLQHLHDRPPTSSDDGDKHRSAQDLSGSVLDAVRAIVEQHCSLASPAANEAFCSNAVVLQVACSVLHTILLLQPDAAVDEMLHSSHVLTAALLHAADVHIRTGGASTSVLSAASQSTSAPVVSVSGAEVSSSGSSSVVSILSRLLTRLSCSKASAPLLNTGQLSTSVALAATALTCDAGAAGEQRALSEVLQCVVQSLYREGVSGVEGCIAITAVHLGALVQALSNPQIYPELACTAATLTAALAHHRKLWVAFHPHSYWTLVEATAASLHLTTHIVRLKALLGQDGAVGSSSADAKQDNSDLTPHQTLLLNKLLKVLLGCVRAMRLLGPTLEDLLCNPDPDVGQWLPPLLQPSFRRSTAPDLQQPNLATLTALLDLCTAHLKEKSSKKEPKDAPSGDGLSGRVLTACAEEALLLLLTQASLALLTPGTSSREARDIRTWLQDDTNSFFSHWLGKRGTASPAPPLAPEGGDGPDRRFLRLAQHLVSCLCLTS